MYGTGFLWPTIAKRFALCWPKGGVGETYNIGGRSEKPNLEIVTTICSILDELRPDDPVVPHPDLSLSSKIGPAMTGAMRLTHARLKGNWDGNPAKRLKQEFVRLCSGTWRMKIGSEGSRAELIVNGWLSNTSLTSE